MRSAACATASGGTSANRREAIDDRNHAAPADRDGPDRALGSPAAQWPDPGTVPAGAILDAGRRLERGGRIWPRSGGNALRGRGLQDVCVRRRHPARRHCRQPAAPAHADHADGFQSLCRAARDSLSGLHRVARHRLRIQDRVRVALWISADHARDRRRHPDHRSAIAACRAEHGGDAEPAPRPRDHPRRHSNRVVRPSRRRRAGDCRRRGLRNADIFGRHRLSDLALPHHPRQPACLCGRTAGIGHGDYLQRRHPMDRAQSRDLAHRNPGRRKRRCRNRARCAAASDVKKNNKEAIVNLPKHLVPTTVVGSYPQPEWLVDRAMLSKSVPRTRMHEMWRLPAEHLEEAQDDATIVAIRDMERAGIDIVTDGEIRRESYSNRFATALDGIDADNPAIITARNGQQTPVPRVVGKIKRSRPVELGDMEFLRRNTDHAAKITLPGPFTMSQQARDEFYKDDEELAMAFADAVNAEALDLQKAGADVIQLDEPWVRNNPQLAKRYAVKAINRALRGITVPTVVHLCFGYAAVVPGSTKPAGYSFLAELDDTNADQISIEAAQPKLDLGVLRDLSSKKIMLGVLDLGSPEIEPVTVVADRIRNGLKHVASDRLVVAPDCGMKYMPRHIAFGKLKAMCDAAATIRNEIS